MNVQVQPLLPEHWEAVKSIFEKGIAGGDATFEMSAPAQWEIWNEEHLPHSRFIAIIDDKVVGWVALSPTSVRERYKGVCELSIYIDPAFTGKGIGKLLMKAVIASIEENGVWMLYSSTFPENKACLAVVANASAVFRTFG